MNLLLILCLAVLGDYSMAYESISPIACTLGGCYFGRLMPGGHTRRPFDGFLGIPFAKPPVGKLRFANPVSLNETWIVPRDATTAAPDCIQKNSLDPNAIVVGAEDCLYLNVYRPVGLSKNTILPVIVFIHGGGYFAGSANPEIIGPEYFMDTCDVVMVTIAYRLGALGFLSTGDKEAPGNFGLKDQVTALNWVQSNIEYFNGNKSSVTIMGVGAGAASVNMHMYSPLSVGLFHKAATLSGNAYGPWTIPTKDPLEIAIRQAEIFGIKKTKTAELVSKLREIEAWRIVNSIDLLKYWYIEPLTPFRPVVEKVSAGAFLTVKEEFKFVLKPNKTIPWIQSVVQNDGAIRAAPILTNPVLLAELNERFDELLPKLLDFDNLKSDVKQDVLTRIKDQYFGGNLSICANSQRFVDLYNDNWYNYPFYKSVHNYLKLGDHNTSSLYLYRFLYNGPVSYSRRYTRTNIDFGVVHQDDTIYLFTSKYFVPFDDCSHYADITRTMVKFYTDFAMNGVPTNLAPVRACTKENAQHGKRFCDYYEFTKGVRGELAVRANDAFNFNMVTFWNGILKTVIKNKS